MKNHILLLVTISTISQSFIPLKKESVVFDAQTTLDQINACLTKRRPVECVKKLPIPADAPVLKGQPLQLVSWIIISAKEHPHRLGVLEAFARKTGSMQEWYKRMHEPLPGMENKFMNILGANIMVGNGDIAFVDFILKNGIHPDEYPEDGKSALFDAVIFDKPEIAAKLLAKGANPNIQDKDGKTPLSFSKSAAMAELLKAAGAKE